MSSFSVSPTLFARNKKLVAVAQDSSVGLYSAKTLRKARIEKLSDFRIVGITLIGDVLHLVDAQRNYFAYEVEQQTILSSGRLEVAASGDAEEGNGPVKPTIVTGRARRAQKIAADDEESLEALSAHFHFAPADTKDGRFRKDDMSITLVTKKGIVQTKPENGAEVARLMMPFPPGLSINNIIVGVSKRNGTVAVAQRNQKWLWIADAFAVGAAAPKHLNLNIGVSAVACQPEGPSVAVGGVRGELAVYPDIFSQNSHFSEHWHHTPMSAIAFSADGAALYTGAAESILLSWNLSNFSFRKLGCSLGTIFSITACEEAPTNLLLSCGESTLATVDLMQHRVAQSVEGVHWSPSHPCTGLVVLPWMGQRCVALTGLPDVVRICDPVSQQAVHALHINYQMETIVAPPTIGISQVAVLDEGRTIVTYETCEAFALPSALRWWRYDPASRKHVEQQCVYNPHRLQITAIVADEQNQRFFTLSADSIKCWAETEAAAGSSATFEQAKQWRNVGTMAPPSSKAGSMALSEDGTVLVVADDAVHAFYVEDIQLGMPWPKIRSFYQDVTTNAIGKVILSDAAKAVVAYSGEHVFTWSLMDATARMAAVLKAPHTVTGVSLFTETTALVATREGILVEVSLEDNEKLGTEVGRTTTHSGIIHIETLRVGSARVALVIEGSGLHVVNVNCTPAKAAAAAAGASPAEDIAVNEELAHAAAAAAVPDAAPLAAYFRVKEAYGAGAGGEEGDATEFKGTREHALAVAGTRRWLSTVVGSEAYSAPPVSSLLPGFMDVLRGDQQ